MTQQALAEELGTVREVVVRELRRLKKEQLLVPAAAGRIPDPAALSRAVVDIYGTS
jgi:DNA-binding transcriptional regulator LsrR (DeoR family)